MTHERIQKVVKKLWEIAKTEFSDYAGFHFEIKPGTGYHHSFAINDQKFHSSNFELELENINDGVENYPGVYRSVKKNCSKISTKYQILS